MGLDWLTTVLADMDTVIRLIVWVSEEALLKSWGNSYI